MVNQVVGEKCHKAAYFSSCSKLRQLPRIQVETFLVTVIYLLNFYVTLYHVIKNAIAASIELVIIFKVGVYIKELVCIYMLKMYISKRINSSINLSTFTYVPKFSN